MPRRVKILSHKQLLLKQPKELPPEPSEPPPPTTDLVSLLVVGDAQAGKTSLIKSFVSHEELPTKGKTKNLQSMPWSVSYTKKKFAFFNQHKSIRSLFVQLLEASGIDPTTSTTTDTAIGHSTEWNRVWNKASMVLLVLNLADEAPQSSSAAFETTLFKRIKVWKRWLDAQHHDPSQPKKPVILMLHQADKLLSSDNKTKYTPAFWMDFGRRIHDTCQRLDLHSWHITSCNPQHQEHASIDAAFVKILGDKGKSPPSSIVTTTPNLKIPISFDNETQLLTPPSENTCTVTPVRAKKLFDSSKAVSPLT